MAGWKERSISDEQGYRPSCDGVRSHFISVDLNGCVLLSLSPNGIAVEGQDYYDELGRRYLLLAELVLQFIQELIYGSIR